MNIHEYQAKRLLHAYGAPVAKGVAVFSAEQAAEWAEKLLTPLCGQKPNSRRWPRQRQV